jgi:hypothetical protein
VRPTPRRDDRDGGPALGAGLAGRRVGGRGGEAAEEVALALEGQPQVRAARHEGHGNGPAACLEMGGNDPSRPRIGDSGAPGGAVALSTESSCARTCVVVF